MPIPAVANTPVVKVRPASVLGLYFRVTVFGLIVFGLLYFYTSSNKTPNPLNKAVADTSIILMGLSMLLSSICYFWNFLDAKIIYRKYLGLIGFAFALVHIVLSYSLLERLFTVTTWQQGSYWPALTGAIAAVIFAVMAIISNTFAASRLGGKTWRFILRTGYLAMFLILAHVVLLKSARWMTWYNEGMQSPPSASLIAAGFIVLVLVMRIILWLTLKKKSKAQYQKIEQRTF